MASTYSTSLRLELIGTGDQSGTWGTTTNTNLGTLLEQAITGVSNVSMTSDADYTLTTVNGGTDQSRQAVLNITSTVSLTATRNIIIPSVNKIYIVKNGTSGSQSLTIKTSSGTGITVKNGYTTAVYCNGTNVYQAIDYLPSVTIDNVLFTDVLGVGSAAVSNVNAYLNTDLSSSSTSQYGLLVNTTPSVSATSAQYGVLSSMQGAAGSSGSPYTTDEVHGLRASAYVPGTYQTVTTQYGVSVANQSGTATFNHAFYTNTSGSSSVSLSSISRASNVVSVATATSHGLAVGDTVVISSATSSFNGIFTVTTAGTTTTFQYNQTGSNETGTASQGYSTKANNWNYYSASSAPNYFNGPTIISASSGMEGLRITQAGSGNALVVEDSTNPDSTPFVVDASGNVIVGNSTTNVITGLSTPQFQVQGTTTGAAGLSVHASDTTSSGGWQSAKSRGTLSAPTIVNSGDNLGVIRFAGYDGSGFIRAAEINGQSDGTPGTNDMPGRLIFSTTADGASSVTERMRIDSSGNLLLGTTSTGSQLTVVGSGQSTAAFDTSTSLGGSLMLGDTGSASNNGGAIIFSANSTSWRFAAIKGLVQNGTANSLGDIAFSTRNATSDSTLTERMRITSAGNLLIGSSTSYNTVAGATAITPRIQVHGTSLSTSALGQYSWGSNAYYTFNKSGGGIGTYTALASGDALGQIQFNGTDGAGFFIGARIQSLVDATPSTGIVPGRIVFQTTDSSGNNVERMRIASTGQVNIGTQGASNVNEIFQIGDSNTNIGIITNTTINGIGLRYDAPTTATGTQRGLMIAFNGGDSASPYTTSNIIGVNISTYAKGTNQTVTNAYGIYVDNVTAASSANYGVFIAAPSGATDNYGIYVSGASTENYFAGKVTTAQGTTGYPAFHAGAAGTQTVTSATNTKVTLTEDFDTNSNFASSRFTPTVAGYYQINAAVWSTAGTAMTYAGVLIYKNGSAYSLSYGAAYTATAANGVVSDIVYLNGSTDYVELYGRVSGTGTLTITNNTYFSGCLIRGA